MISRNFSFLKVDFQAQLDQANGLDKPQVWVAPSSLNVVLVIKNIEYFSFPQIPFFCLFCLSIHSLSSLVILWGWLNGLHSGRWH